MREQPNLNIPQGAQNKEKWGVQTAIAGSQKATPATNPQYRFALLEENGLKRLNASTRRVGCGEMSKVRNGNVLSNGVRKA